MPCHSKWTGSAFFVCVCCLILKMLFLLKSHPRPLPSVRFGLENPLAHSKPILIQSHTHATHHPCQPIPKPMQYPYHLLPIPIPSPTHVILLQFFRAIHPQKHTQKDGIWIFWAAHFCYVQSLGFSGPRAFIILVLNPYQNLNFLGRALFQCRKLCFVWQFVAFPWFCYLDLSLWNWHELRYRRAQ